MAGLDQFFATDVDEAKASVACPPPALALARAKLKPPIRHEPLWRLLAAAGLCAASALCFAAAVILGPPNLGPDATVERQPVDRGQLTRS